MTWSYLIIIIAPDNYTDFEVICIYGIVSSLIYPLGAWYLRLRYEKNSKRAPLTGFLQSKKRYKLYAAVDMLLLPAFTMGNSVCHSTWFNVTFTYYLSDWVDGVGDLATSLYWIALAMLATFVIYLIEVGSTFAMEALQVEVQASEMKRKSQILLQESELLFRDSGKERKRDKVKRSVSEKVQKGGLVFVLFWPYFFNTLCNSFGTTVGWVWNFAIYETCITLFGFNSDNIFSFWGVKVVPPDPT